MVMSDALKKYQYLQPSRKLALAFYIINRNIYLYKYINLCISFMERVCVCVCPFIGRVNTLKYILDHIVLVYHQQK